MGIQKVILAAMSTMQQNLHGFLNPNDAVAISFWIISISMVAATVFFLMESMNVAYHWKTSMNVGALVTLVAAVHYFYMREFWVTLHSSPILYRYIDWSITVPLQMIEFYLILSAVQRNISGMMFWRLLIGTIIMLAAGYSGEAGFVPPMMGFIVGMCGWGFILFEIFMGEAFSVCLWRQGEQARTGLFQHHAFHRHSRLVYLPPWLLLWIFDGCCGGQHSQFGVQPC